MEQPCYKCGQAVEESVPFCPHCRAPQIRVVVATPVPSPAVSAGVSEASQVSAALPNSSSVALPTHRVHFLKSAALAALVASILASLRLNIFVSMLGAGFLAVVFYRQQMPGIGIKAAVGARVGALSGLLFFVYFAAVAAVASAFLGTNIREQILDNAQKWAASRPPEPQIQAALEQLKTPAGFIVAFVVGCVILLVVCVALASLSGSLAGVILSRRDKT
jgi:hypothetical protein